MSDHHTPKPMLASPAAAVATGARSSRVTARPPSREDPDALMDRVLEMLGENYHHGARRLCRKALDLYPEHPRVRGVWSIFDNRDKATVVPGSDEPSTVEELEWLENPPEWAHGKWVALLGSEIVASAETLAEVVEILRSKSLPRQPLIHRIDDGS